MCNKRRVGKGHPQFCFQVPSEFAPCYVSVFRGSELAISFLTLPEMRQGMSSADAWIAATAMVLSVSISKRGLAEVRTISVETGV